MYILLGKNSLGLDILTFVDVSFCALMIPSPPFPITAPPEIEGIRTLR